MTDKQLWSTIPPQQRAVLRCLAVGMTCKTCAFKLRISAKTVEYHRRQIYVLLGLQSGDRDPAIMAARFAIRVGAVTA